jgi:DNA-directed RNA polymerase subunit RPC12/RpoP
MTNFNYDGYKSSKTFTNSLKCSICNKIITLYEKERYGVCKECFYNT